LHEAYFTVRELKRAYEQAVKENRDGFVLKGCQFHTGYAKYLLEYLIGMKKVRLNQRMVFTQQEPQDPFWRIA